MSTIEGWKLDRKNKTATCCLPNHFTEVSIEPDVNGETCIRVRCDDDDKIYAHGSSTSTLIPHAVLLELIAWEDDE
jgi:hypothetical protein